MFFASAPSVFQSSVRRPVYAHAGRSVDRFLQDALFTARQNGTAYTQDETSYTLTLDMPGIAKEQLGISIDGAVVRIQSKEDAPRRYRAAYEFPLDIDSAASEAKLENGVLTLKLAKKVPVNTATELTIL
ncbi:Hsp20/alpha crystallin family protein [uncultured Rhodoferax sp.]|uniref:Hsp20/alpha crystallin family protein n=1 Tax=uncultured Rhodoferax sp. TaxID=223188 RepID=UPI0025CCA6E1|nr:Hsp20/alpha crystallin family protein [uncultured Rhodoferax sp.]